MITDRPKTQVSPPLTADSDRIAPSQVHPANIPQTQSSEGSKTESSVPPGTTSAPHNSKLPLPQHSKKSNTVTTILFWMIVSGIGYASWHYQSQWLPYATSLFGRTHGSASAPAGKSRVAKPVPVLTSRAHKRTMRLYLNGLGTVTPIKTVTIRSRVEGELQSVNFTEGRLVREGDELAQIDPRPFEVERDQATGALVRDEATLRSAKLNLERLRKLLPTRAITEQEVEEAQALVQQTEGAILTDKATVAHAELQLTYCRIVAPISGRIGLRMVDPGNYIRANDPTGLAVITQLQPIALIFTIPQDDIARVQQAMRTGQSLVVDAFDRDFTTKLASGKLDALDNQVDPLTGTVRLKAVFEQDDHLLFPNQFVNARLLVETRNDVLVVPSAAVQRGPASTFVYVVKSDNSVELRDVKIGPVEGLETAIESGLLPGEVVVTDGLDKLQKGSKVVPTEKTVAGATPTSEERAKTKADKESPKATDNKSQQQTGPEFTRPAASQVTG